MLALSEAAAVLDSQPSADAAPDVVGIVAQSPPLDTAPTASTDGLSQRAASAEGQLTLAAGVALFKAGDKRTGYFRVDSGVLRHSLHRADGAPSLIEFLFPGDIAGLGFLERHVSWAEALLETRLTPVSADELDRLLVADESLDGRLAAAIDLEFSVLRERAVAASAGNPMERLAAYLLAVSSINAPETGDSALFPGRLTCGYVAQVLGLDLETLEKALKKLETRGIVKATGKGLELRNFTALNMLADGL